MRVRKRTEDERYIHLGKQPEVEVDDFNDDELEDEIDVTCDLINDYEKKKRADLADDIIFFSGLFAATAVVLGIVVLTGKAIIRILK